MNQKFTVAGSFHVCIHPELPSQDRSTVIFQRWSKEQAGFSSCLKYYGDEGQKLAIARNNS